MSTKTTAPEFSAAEKEAGEDVFIEARHIRKVFVEHTALDDVSIEVRKGRIFGLLGPNGAGKTTLIRILNRITAPDSGAVYFNGREMRAEDVQRIGYLPEERGLYKKMKVGEQAIYLAQLKGMTKKEAEKRLRAWFEKFDITPWWNKKLEELSKGMAQKVQFIITVLHDPEFLIFDEPFSGFDPVNVELLKREIVELKERGRTIIFSTHNMESVEELCDDFALFNHSQVVLSGSVEEVKQQFRTGLYLLSTPSHTLAEHAAQYDVVEHTQAGGISHYTLKKQPEVSNNELLGALVEQCEIRAFEEQMPTMHDIFLDTIGSDASWSQQQYETLKQTKDE